MSAPSDDGRQPTVREHVLVGHEGDEGFTVRDDVREQKLGHLVCGCFGLGSGLGVMHVDTGGLEFLKGGVIDEDLFPVGEGASV